MANEKRLIELGEALRMVQNSKDDCPETSIKGRAIWETAHNCALSCLTSCPAVEAVEVVHGRWVCLEAEIGYFACSECDHRILRAKCNYCPHCGAKMDGGDEDG